MLKSSRLTLRILPYAFGLTVSLPIGLLTARQAAADATLVPLTPTTKVATSPAATAEQADFFESKVRPVLANNCFSCHGPNKQSAGLRLDSAAAMLKGSASGPAVVPGDIEKSLLVKAIRYDHDDLQMPPAGKLKDMDIAALTAWVKMGAAWPNATGVVPASSPATAAASAYVIKPEQKTFWSFQPVRKTAPPPVKNKAWVKSPLDQFILAKLEAKGLTPAPPASRSVLIRRAYFDLIGLPPSPDEVVAFVSDKSPDAYAKLLDRLLAMPQYGERWGRRWLDVARYADSNGLDENIAFGNAWRYRDYVIAAYNADKPYSEFIKEQIAGDLMPSDNDAVRNERLTATGFLCLGAKVLAEPEKPKLTMDIIDEQIETTSKAVLGLTVACARCHDHKFDPIPTKDYYALAGIFKSTRTMETLNTVARVNQRPLASKEIEAEAKVKQEDVKRAQDEVKKITDAANNDLAAGFKRDVGKYVLAGWELAQQPGLYSVAETPVKPGDPQRIIIEAEKFNRGNFAPDFDTYGKGIGIIHTVDGSDFAEWDITVPTAGSYQLELRYAAQESRPVRLKLNGQTILEDAATKVTGSWQPEGQQWEPQGIFPFEAGKNVLRLESKGAIPHIDKLLVVVAAPAPTGGNATPPRPLQTIATERGLNPAALKAWAPVLHPLLDNPAFKTWHSLAVAPAAEFNTAAAQVAQRLGDEKDADLAPVRAAFKDAKGPLAVPDKPEEYYTPDVKASLVKANVTLKQAQDAVPQLPMAIAVEDGTVEDVKVHIRGSVLNLGDTVPRHFLIIVSGDKQAPLSDKSSGRLELANWMTSPTQPLTARVAVNRIWAGHFGAGIVRTPDNFGKMGERPSHPELLDWLAATFMEKGWSMKQMHRMIMLSNTYQMSSDLDAKANEVDPDNRLFWRMNRRRLEVEPFRDSLLKVAGDLDLKMGGSLLMTKDADYVTNDQSRDGAQYTAPRRSIYLPVIRNSLYDMFQAFDFGDPSAVVAQRASTTVAPQALFMMNSPFILDQAKAFATDLLSHTNMTDAQLIRAAYLRAFGRSPQPAEITRVTSFMARYDAQLAPTAPDTTKRRLKVWQSLCQVLMASNEFVYVN